MRAIHRACADGLLTARDFKNAGRFSAVRIRTITDLLINRETAQVLAAQVSALAGVLAVAAAGARRDLAQRLMANVRLLSAALSGDGDAPYEEMRKAAKLDLSGELFEALQSSGVLQQFEDAGLPPEK